MGPGNVIFNDYGTILAISLSARAIFVECTLLLHLTKNAVFDPITNWFLNYHPGWGSTTYQHRPHGFDEFYDNGLKSDYIL